MDNLIDKPNRAIQTLQRLATIAEQATEGIAAIDLDGILCFANISWAQMHGYESVNEAVGKHISEFHSAEQMRADVLPFMEETKHRGLLSGPIEHIRRDGATFSTHTKMTAVKNEDGQTIGFLTFAVDVTVSRQQAEQLNVVKKQLQQNLVEHRQAEEQLQQQIDELNEVKEQVRQYRRQLQDSEGRTAELKAANEQLRQELPRLQELDKHLQQQTEELNEVKQQLDSQTAQRQQIEDRSRKYCSNLEFAEQYGEQIQAAKERLQQQIGGLKNAREHLHRQTEKLSQVREQLRNQTFEWEELENELQEQDKQLQQDLIIHHEAEKELQNQINELSKAKSRRADIRTSGEERRIVPDLTAVEAVEEDGGSSYEGTGALAEGIRVHPIDGLHGAAIGLSHRRRKLVLRSLIGATGAVLALVLLLGAVFDVRMRRELRALAHADILSKARETFNNGRLGEAMTQVGTILDSGYVGPQARLLRANILAEAMNSDDAISELEGLLDEEPNIAGASHLLLARLYMDSELDDETKKHKVDEHRSRAVELLGETADSYYLCALDARTATESMDYLNKGLVLDPRHYESLAMRANAYCTAHQYPEMEADAMAMIVSRPEDPRGYSLRAIARRHRDKYAEAIEDHDLAIRYAFGDDKTSVEVQKECCKTLLAAGEYTRLVLDAENWLELGADEEFFLFHAFCAHMALGDYDSATGTFGRILKLDSGAREFFAYWSMKYVLDILAAPVQQTSFGPPLAAEIVREPGVAKHLCLVGKLFAGDDKKLCAVWEHIENGGLAEILRMPSRLQSSPPKSGLDCTESVEKAVRDLALGYAFLRDQRYDEAVEHYKEVVEDAAEAYELAGWRDYHTTMVLAAAHAGAGDFGLAIRWQKIAIGLLSPEEQSRIKAFAQALLDLYQEKEPHYQQVVIPDQMIAWWKLDGATDGTTADSSGNGLDGTLVGDAQIVDDPDRGKVLKLDGDGDWVECGDDIRLKMTGPMTISAWFKIHEFDKNSQAIITKGNSSWRLQCDGEKDTVEFACTGLDVPVDPFFGIVGGRVNDGRWHHVACVYDTATSTLYLDSRHKVSNRSLPQTSTDSSSLQIGANSTYKSAASGEWNGLIDDVRVYNYALGESQVRDLFVGSGPGPELRNDNQRGEPYSSVALPAVIAR